VLGTWTIGIVLLIWFIVSIPVSLVAARLLARASDRCPPPLVPQQRAAEPGARARRAAPQLRRALVLATGAAALTTWTVSAAAALGLPLPAHDTTATLLEAVSPFHIPDSEARSTSAASGARPAPTPISPGSVLPAIPLAAPSPTTVEMREPRLEREVPAVRPGQTSQPLPGAPTGAPDPSAAVPVLPATPSPTADPSAPASPSPTPSASPSPSVEPSSPAPEPPTPSPEVPSPSQTPSPDPSSPEPSATPSPVVVSPEPVQATPSPEDRSPEAPTPSESASPEVTPTPVGG